MTHTDVSRLAEATRADIKVLTRQRQDRHGQGRTLAERNVIDAQIADLKHQWWEGCRAEFAQIWRDRDAEHRRLAVENHTKLKEIEK